MNIHWEADLATSAGTSMFVSTLYLMVNMLQQQQLTLDPGGCCTCMDS